MNKNKTQVIKLTWQDIDYFANRLLGKIEKIKYDPDIIVTIKRGGLIPAVILSHKLDVRDVVVIDASRTEDDTVNAQKHKPKLYFDERELSKIEGKKVLLIDDIVGSGETLKDVKDLLIRFNPSSIITASLVINLNNLKNKKLKPNIVAKEMQAWIIFPWENNRSA